MKQKRTENKGGVRNTSLWGRRAYQFDRFLGLGHSFFSQK
jgi:hypothetical protein